MNVYNLPQDIFPDSKILADDIIIHDYAAKAGSFKGKSVLHRNAISMVISGEKTMHFAEKTIEINDNEFHFLSAGNCLASMDLSKQDIFRSILIFFDNKVLVDFFVKYDNLIAAYKTKPIVKQSYISFAKDEFIRNYIASLLLIFKTGQHISMQMKQLKFEELMLYLLEKYPLTILSFQNPQKNSFDDLVIRKAIETNITNNLTLDELAFLCNMSVSTFKRRFLKIYNTSPMKWQLRRRMEIAANLLQNHHQKPGEVFHQLGYQNHSSFTQSFKQVYGITPKEYQLQKMNV